MDWSQGMRSRLNSGVALPVSAALLRLTNRKGALKRISRARVRILAVRDAGPRLLRAFSAHLLRTGVSLDFRSRLLRTLRAVEPILGVPGVLVVGSEVPNLLEPNARSSLVVSQDVDIAVPVASHADVKARLPRLHGLSPSREEPSVWLPAGDNMIEVNFIGMDPNSDRSGETYVLVALGLLLVCTASDLLELQGSYWTLSDEERHIVKFALSTLSLLEPLADMPDPIPHRQRIAALMTRLEKKER